MRSKPSFHAGDLVIYAMPKRSRQPGPRARSIYPAPMGDDYGYVVDKFWVVSQMLGDDQVLLKTRRGKTRIVQIEDPLLRKARWWERWRYRSRFPDPRVALTGVADKDDALASAAVTVSATSVSEKS